MVTGMKGRYFLGFLGFGIEKCSKNLFPLFFFRLFLLYGRRTRGRDKLI
jgi:hypothetical protein